MSYHYMIYITFPPPCAMQKRLYAKIGLAIEHFRVFASYGILML